MFLLFSEACNELIYRYIIYIFIIKIILFVMTISFDDVNITNLNFKTIFYSTKISLQQKINIPFVFVCVLLFVAFSISKFTYFLPSDFTIHEFTPLPS